MRYLSFTIRNYRAIKGPLKVNLKDKRLIPIVGINECGKTTILQAIYCFDYTNDKEYKGKHLQNIKNLYETIHDEGSVEAEIACTKPELDKIIENVIIDINKKYITKSDGQNFKKIDKNEFLNKARNVNGDSVSITRNLNTKNYTFSYLKSEDLEIQNAIARYIIERELPYILYNDDFTDRPESVIKIPEERPEQLSGWLAIYERACQAANKEFSLFKLANITDNREKNSILSEIEKNLNNKLTQDWEKFSVDNNKLKIKLDVNNNELNIQIKETIGGNERFFDVVDRSKGFLWFYNFIMKVRFNAKANIKSGLEKDTIFLLDEPGSYLHLNAQDKLCSNLNKISSEDGIVIYCTHSHHLLNPEYIPINNIHITEKKPKKLVQLISINEYKTNIEKKNALQPVYEALGLSPYEVLNENYKIVCVEGIYDKYVIEMFCNLDDNTIVFPGVSADSIKKSIPYFIAYGKKYVAIWDNDKEGREQCEKAKKYFGEEEAKKFKLLPKGNKEKMRMENMFKKEDYEAIIKKLNLNENSTYESIILTAYYSEIKGKIISCLSEETKQRFNQLSEIINEIIK